MIAYLLFFCCTTSFAEMQNFDKFPRNTVDLLQMEDELLSHMNQYALGLQRKVDMLRLVLAEAEARETQANGDPTLFLANPVTSLSLFRRVYEDVPKLVDFLKLEMEPDSRNAILKYNLSTVNEKKFKEAANDFLLIKNVYDLNAEDMANGFINHKQYDANMSSLDCLALGNHFTEDLDQGHLAIKWLKLALERYDDKLKPLDRLLTGGRFHILQNLVKVQISMRKNKKNRL